MNKRQKTQLLKLASLLEKVPKKAFNLKRWIRSKDYNGWWYTEKSPEKLIKDLKKNLKGRTCGTVACAIGYLPTITRTMKIYGEETIKNVKTGHCGTLGAAEYFGISSEESEYLFLPKHNYNSKERVIARIRDFCKNYKKS